METVFMRTLLYRAAAGILLAVVIMGVTGCARSREEQMLVYMEEKYGESFEMIGSYAGQIGKDYTMALVRSFNRPQDQALVRLTHRKEEEVYQDNYLAYLLKEKIEAVLLEDASEIYGECKVIYKVPYLVFPETFGPDMGAEAFLKQKEAGVQIFIYPKSGCENQIRNQEAFEMRIRQKGYRISGVVSYPKSEEMYQRISGRNISRDGYLGYEAIAESTFFVP